MDELVKKCAGRLRRWLGNELPEAALVLGSGFHEILNSFRIEKSIHFSRLPGFPAARVEGHSSSLVLANLRGWKILVLGGRAHFYEGLEMREVMLPTRVLAHAGVKELFLTNAAGGINPGYRPGDFMLFSDHINFTGQNPLRGAPVASGQCFVDLTQAYSPRLRGEFQKSARKAKVRVHEGVYLGVSGPTYETPAEIRAFRSWGADAVGMSTIPEVLMARYCGMEVAAISCITNYAAGLRGKKLSHREVLEAGRQSADAAAAWFSAFAERRISANKES